MDVEAALQGNAHVAMLVHGGVRELGALDGRSPAYPLRWARGPGWRAIPSP
jgi:hypothetical protein